MWRISVILFALLVAGAAYSQPLIVEDKNKHTTKAYKKTDSDQRGTEKSPLIIKTLPTKTAEAQTKQEENYKAEHGYNERWTMRAAVGLVIVTSILAFFTYRLWRATKTMVEGAEKVSDSQLREMRKSIAEATRAASAIEKVAEHIAISAKAATESVAAVKDRTAQQMRAYLTVLIGTAVCQDIGNTLRFEAKPLLLNTGHTPARKVGYRAKAAILPIPLPDDFAFPLPEVVIGAALLGPQQNFILSAMVDGFCDSSEVEDIKFNKGKALYMWGSVTYEDVFGESRQTKFCYRVFFFPDGSCMGYWDNRHNDAT